MGEWTARRAAGERHRVDARSAGDIDYARVIHSASFRRLQGKTQILNLGDSDFYRTRLTHSLEVAQIAGGLVAQLAKSFPAHPATAILPDRAMIHAIACAHDLGHPPFGHTGEDALHELMAPYGGFDHNAQALRIVTKLEKHYAGFDGLNLTWETLEGIAKHNGPAISDHGGSHSAPTRELLPYALIEVDNLWDLELSTNASAEAQVAAVADDCAYNHHDLHDGLRAGLFTEDDLCELPVIGECFAEVDRLHPGLEPMRRRHEALRRVFGVMVEDVIAVAENRLTALQPQSVDDIRSMEGPIIRFSKPLYQELKAVRSCLLTRMYRAPSVMVERARVRPV